MIQEIEIELEIDMEMKIEIDCSGFLSHFVDVVFILFLV